MCIFRTKLSNSEEVVLMEPLLVHPPFPHYFSTTIWGSLITFPKFGSSADTSVYVRDTHLCGIFSVHSTHVQTLHQSLCFQVTNYQWMPRLMHGPVASSFSCRILGIIVLSLSYRCFKVGISDSDKVKRIFGYLKTKRLFIFLI